MLDSVGFGVGLIVPVIAGQFGSQVKPCKIDLGFAEAPFVLVHDQGLSFGQCNFAGIA